MAVSVLLNTAEEEIPGYRWIGTFNPFSHLDEKEPPYSDRDIRNLTGKRWDIPAEDIMIRDSRIMEGGRAVYVPENASPKKHELLPKHELEQEIKQRSG